jgi:hypothetical protein
VNFQYRASETFWRKFYALSSKEKESCRDKFKVFKLDPFDARLGTHKINKLSALAKKTIYSVVIEADLRVLFYIEGSLVFTFDIGSHAIYD